MTTEENFSLIVSGRVILVRRREGTDTVFDATFQDPLPSGPEGFTIGAAIPPVGDAEMDAIAYPPSLPTSTKIPTIFFFMTPMVIAAWVALRF